MYIYSTLCCKIVTVDNAVNVQHIKNCKLTVESIGDFAASRFYCKFTVVAFYSEAIDNSSTKKLDNSTAPTSGAAMYVFITVSKA